MLSLTPIQEPIRRTELTPLSKSILRVLLYFKIFDYPVTKEELFQFVSSDNKIEIQASLARLVRDGMVCSRGGYVWVMNDEAIIPVRAKGNASAERYLKVARRQARILSWFPFIKCICISGSLSKYYMDSHSDIDYFIIAKQGRLWLTKLLMSIIVETLEVLRLEKYFCPNYIITENNLHIADRNIFTAMEIVTLVPLYNQEEYERFLHANEWIKDYFPQYQMNLPVKSFGYSKKLLRTVWNHGFFGWVDKHILRFYQWRYERKIKAGKIRASGTDMVITESDYKLHLSGHRRRILQQYENNIRIFEDSFDVVL